MCSVVDAISVTEIEEKALARWLFTSPFVPSTVLEELGFGRPCQVALEVQTAALFGETRLPGDIDVLVNHTAPSDKATAIEFKRVKVPTRAFFTGLPNKIRDLKRGVRQANALHDLGFARAFLLVAIVTDGRDRTHVGWPFRGPTEELLNTIRQFPGIDRLHPEVGLGFLEITQPVDKPIENAGGIGVYFQKEPAICAQDQLITNVVQMFFERRKI